MSTAPTGRPVGDNEFPVLLRLPDLNAPAWAPIATASPLASATAVETSLQSSHTGVVGTVSQASNAASALVPPVSPATSPATTVQDVAPSPTVEKTRPSTTRAERSARTERAPAAGQWTLIRQLATGGVLVGGLALMYLYVMSGGEEETPNHVPVANSTLEPPVIETPGLGSNVPVVVQADGGTSHSDLAKVGPPPDFSTSWRDDSSLPPHIEVVDNERRAAEARSPVLPPDPTTDVGRYQGRIGPEASPRTPIAATNYPTTDPATYLYRPMTNEPGPDAARTAQRDGFEALAPRR